MPGAAPSATSSTFTSRPFSAQIARIWAARSGVGSKATTIAGVRAAASHEKTPMFAPTSKTGAEPRYLHQSRTPDAGTDDLAEALAGGLPDGQPWRVHFHVPLHAEPEPPLTSTAPELTRTLAALVGGPRALTAHLEAETYTWQVLPTPPSGPAALVAGIAAELAWTRDRLRELGLEDVA